jgi:hypothetical protein
MTFPKDITDHHKADLHQKCVYLVAQFKNKDLALWQKYSEELKTLKVEDSWDYFHMLLVEYQKLVDKPDLKKPTEAKPAAPAKKAVKESKPAPAPAKKAAAPAKKAAKAPAKKTAAKKVAKKAPAKKAPAKKTAAKKVAKKAAAKKVAAKKVAKKAPAKKVAAKKPVAKKKAVAKKAPAKKVAKKAKKK